ncbi:MAG TPA: decaprenyl-phosphate phosphoribosyltransferase [Phnomibacter sp.]|nr:decaprenyl-phosphate phosphoribosyltransferase [Phnomibacter sp.]
MQYFKLLRVKEWVKNLFLFVPLFFAGELFHWENVLKVLPAFFAFSFIASAVYIINDYRDREDDRKHPIKCKRPLAAGTVSLPLVGLLLVLLIAAGFGMAYVADDRLKFMFVLGIYFALNLGYSMGLKNISILDIIIISAGFVLRIKGGSVVTSVPLSEWLNIMVFLLAMFMAIAKRRDDVLIKLESGTDMRQSIKGYSLEFLNVCIAFFCAVIVVAYFMYTMSPEVEERMHTNRLYYTCMFVLAGILRYLQIVFVVQQSGSPTKILIRDRFIQLTILLWGASFYAILYLKEDVVFFK